MAKKETRGRKPKLHTLIDLSFDQMLDAIGKAKKKTRQQRKKR